MRSLAGQLVRYQRRQDWAKLLFCIWSTSALHMAARHFFFPPPRNTIFLYLGKFGTASPPHHPFPACPRIAFLSPSYRARLSQSLKYYIGLPPDEIQMRINFALRETCDPRNFQLARRAIRTQASRDEAIDRR